MLTKFLKYQSLSNDFVVFDWYKKDEICIKNALQKTDFSQNVRSMCHRRLGIGADGVLILKIAENTNLPELLIFNADGSSAEMCMNGLRCIALHLYTIHQFPTQFSVKIGKRIVDSHILIQKDPNQILIKTSVGLVDYLGERCITTSQGDFCGHVASVGNPHFVLLSNSTRNQISIEWLEKYGSELEQHKAFENKTNVEFVWEEKPLFYKSLVYERGCGVTQACGSGAAAIAGTLSKLGLINPEQTFNIEMPGGLFECMVSTNGDVCISAEAKFVFSGMYNSLSI